MNFVTAVSFEIALIDTVDVNRRGATKYDLRVTVFKLALIYTMHRNAANISQTLVVPRNLKSIYRPHSRKTVTPYRFLWDNF